MRGALDDDVILVLTPRELVVNLVELQVTVRAHRRDQ